MTALKRPANWDEAKKVLGEAGFMEKLLRFNKDTLDDALLKKLGKFTNDKEFTPDIVGKVSSAAKGMCLWVHAMKVRVNSVTTITYQPCCGQYQQHLRWQPQPDLQSECDVP
jgi:hypothetical protein